MNNLLKQLGLATFLISSNLSLTSCENKVETIKIEIDRSFGETVETPLIKFAENIELFGILEPSNFWYEEGTTFKEALKDEFQFPVTRLRTLKKIIGEIKTEDSKINALINSLKKILISK